jgi:hypothetical protein
MLSRLFGPKSCPLPQSGVRCTRIQVRDIVPLVGFVVPTVVIGYGFVIPKSPIAGVNELTIGFGLTIVGACVTYLIGVRGARKN